MGAAAKRLRMEELSTLWQRSPASPPQAHLADGGNTNYPRASGSCVVRVMLSWSCATPLSIRLRCRGERGETVRGDPQGRGATSLPRGCCSKPRVQESEQELETGLAFPHLALDALISLIPPRNSQKNK